MHLAQIFVVVMESVTDRTLCAHVSRAGLVGTVLFANVPWVDLGLTKLPQQIQLMRLFLALTVVFAIMLLVHVPACLGLRALPVIECHAS